MPLTSPEQARPWRAHAADLSQWAQEHLVNRSDIWRSYLPERKRTPEQDTVLNESRLNEKALARHFGATDSAHVIALNSSDNEGQARWLAIQIERHDEEEPVRPGANFQVALAWYDKLESMGFAPILEDIDGAGGFRLLVLFESPTVAEKAAWFGQELTTDYADHGVQQAPALFPAPPGDSEHGEGTWLRLPGHHPYRNHWSRLWSGAEWLTPEASVELLLASRKSEPHLIRTPRPQVVRHLPDIKQNAIDPDESAALPEPPAPPPVSESSRPANPAWPTTPAVPSTRSQEPMPTESTTVTEPIASVDDSSAAATQVPPAQTVAETSETGMSIKDPSFLDPARTTIAGIANRTGLREAEIVKRVFAWVEDQDEVIQAVVLGQIPQAIRPSAARLTLERLSKEAG